MLSLLAEKRILFIFIMIVTFIVARAAAISDIRDFFNRSRNQDDSGYVRLLLNDQDQISVFLVDGKNGYTSLIDGRSSEREAAELGWIEGRMSEDVSRPPLQSSISFETMTNRNGESSTYYRLLTASVVSNEKEVSCYFLGLEGQYPTIRGSLLGSQPRTYLWQFQTVTEIFCALDEPDRVKILVRPAIDGKKLFELPLQQIARDPSRVRAVEEAKIDYAIKRLREDVSSGSSTNVGSRATNDSDLTIAEQDAFPLQQATLLDHDMMGCRPIVYDNQRDPTAGPLFLAPYILYSRDLLRTAEDVVAFYCDSRLPFVWFSPRGDPSYVPWNVDWFVVGHPPLDYMDPPRGPGGDFFE